MSNSSCPPERCIFPIVLPSQSCMSMDLSCIRHFCDGDRILLTSVWCQYKRYERVHEKVVGKSERRGRFIVPSADYDFSQPRSARGSVGAIKDLTRRAPRSFAALRMTSYYRSWS